MELEHIKLYHIIHYDKLPHILELGEEGLLICDNDLRKQNPLGTNIGMNKIKDRRMNELTFKSYPDLYVGSCVPFYFSPKSVMLYMLHKSNSYELFYRGGQEPIIHLVFNMTDVIDWADQNYRRWVFTDSNAGSRYFNDYCRLADIDKLDWPAIQAKVWVNCKEKKQAEFLVEDSLPWTLVEEIGVYSFEYSKIVHQLIEEAEHKPIIKIKREWYY